MTTVWVICGLVAFGWTGAMFAPPSRELMIKLGTLMDWCRRENPQLYASALAPITPFVGKAFKHNRLKGILRADMSGFGEVCARLQREARKLDVKAHIAMIPAGIYLLALGVWYFARG